MKIDYLIQAVALKVKKNYIAGLIFRHENAMMENLKKRKKIL